MFYLNQRLSPLTDQTNRVPSQNICNHLNKQEAMPLMNMTTKPFVKQQLDSICVNKFYPVIGLNDEESKAYLNTPPVGN